jgi:hypothetical protein
VSNLLAAQNSMGLYGDETLVHGLYYESNSDNGVETGK